VLLEDGVLALLPKKTKQRVIAWIAILKLGAFPSFERSMHFCQTSSCESTIHPQIYLTSTEVGYINFLPNCLSSMWEFSQRASRMDTSFVTCYWTA